MTIVSNSSAPMDPDDSGSKPVASPRPATPPARVDLKQLLNNGDASAAPVPEPKSDSKSPTHSALSDESLKKIKALRESTISRPSPKSVKPGHYSATLLRGYWDKTTNDNPMLVLKFMINGGENDGKTLTHTPILTANTMYFVEPQLQELGLTDDEQTKNPVPQPLSCSISVGMDRKQDGREWNRITRFKVLGIAAPEMNPFLPPQSTPEGSAS